MAKSTLSRGFKDISLSFRKHPVTNDILALKNEDAIKVSVINLVRTGLGERFYDPNIGTIIQESLFENQSLEIAHSIETTVSVLLNNYEPRIEVQSVAVTFPQDSYEMNVDIRYLIVGQSAPVQNIDFILQPTRI